jgi:hypothetical protein
LKGEAVQWLSFPKTRSGRIRTAETGLFGWGGETRVCASRAITARLEAAPGDRPLTSVVERFAVKKAGLGQGGISNSENSKANQDRNYERSRGIWTNLFGGSKKNSKENSEK